MLPNERGRELDAAVDYSGNGDVAKSVLRKMRDAARKMLESRKGADHAD